LCPRPIDPKRLIGVEAMTQGFGVEASDAAGLTDEMALVRKPQKSSLQKNNESTAVQKMGLL
jgi:hypothetical protein